MKARKHLDIRLPHLRIPLWWPALPGNWRAWLPSRGNVLFTLLVVAGLLWATSAGALPLRSPQSAVSSSTGTIAYQGRLADSAGNPITDTVNMEFRLYDVAAGGTALWSELWTGSNAVRVSDGLFNVMLGSLEPIPQDVVAGHDQLFLGITVGTDDEMTPRVQLGSVPFAVQALTVPDGSVTTAKININDHLDMHKKEIHNIANLVFPYDDVRAIKYRGRNPDGFVIQTLNDSGQDIARMGFGVGNYPHLYITNALLNMNGNPIINQGAMVEAGLQTPDELAAERIDRFEQGDVLCWAGKQLEKCDQANDRRVVAVADENGKPIVIGAEKIKVIGPVQAGDLLVASDVPGYAIVNNQPAPGTVIAKALEDFAGQRGTIKAMIRTP